MIGPIWQNLGEKTQSAEMADDSGIFKTASFQERLDFSFKSSIGNGMQIDRGEETGWLSAPNNTKPLQNLRKKPSRKYFIWDPGFLNPCA